MTKREKWIMEPVTLTPEQDERALRALAIFEAQCAALHAGYSLAEVRAMRWVVKIDGREVE
jgi:hypothetical protein